MATLSEIRDRERLQGLQVAFRSSDDPVGLEGNMHARLRALGIAPDRCVLVNWFPDDGAWVLELVTSDFQVLKVELESAAEDDRVEVVGRFPRGGRRRVQRVDRLVAELASCDVSR